jgi:predicted tellurium resistance membrane protein TerC
MPIPFAGNRGNAYDSEVGFVSRMESAAMRRVPTTGFVIGILLLGWFASRHAEGNDPAAVTPNDPGKKLPAQKLQVRVDLHPELPPGISPGGDKLEGSMELTGVTLETETGTQTVKPEFLRRITFAEEGQDAVETTDKNVIRGHVTQDTWRVTTSAGIQGLPRKVIREIHVVRPMDTSVLGIAIGLITLAAMEIVLGVDNIIFLAIVAARLPEESRPKARKIGLAAALGTRLLLLFSLSFLLGLTAPVFTLPDMPILHDLEAREVSWRDIILLVGGVFLIGKSTMEMHEKLEHAKNEAKPEAAKKPKVAASFARVIATIAVVDIIFSLDSVITAVGMVDELWVMATAMVIAMLVMMLFSERVSRFVDKHPTIKVLALSFLILIGVMLVAESLGQHIDKGYIYFAMAFAVVVEMVNLRLRKKPEISHG